MLLMKVTVHNINYGYMLPSHVIKMRFSSATASFFIDPTALQLGQDQSIFIGQNRSIQLMYKESRIHSR